ncbi:polysaccharide deacetylase family protein [Chryseolinea sp. H1M3-3]|uniref:polysaccharide deacetylase family protein n=1 Tax=Chryseolinea sp. H1M3-3 TaxID=3034144 RepID=UPI0023ECD096|nr:polysaccharide deacetylase family protein [Chryseolinea sp. H1M3-3]
MSSIFIISLDFELHWGGFEKWPLQDYRQYFLNTRCIIPELLKAFSERGIHVTWAAVGMLFYDSKRSLLQNIPLLTPSYRSKELSAYHYIKNVGIGDSETEDPFHFAQTLVKQIIKTPYQELSSHTFAHYYCNEPGQTLDQFRADLKAAQHAAGMFKKKLKSLVFPRNQFNEEYLKICYEEGFIAVRDNPRDWFWNIRSTQKESLWKRFNRGMDAYFPIGKENTYALSNLHFQSGLPISIPASRLLRPYRPKEFILNDVKIARIKSEMTRAATKNEIYHLWWHPHNFGHYPKESMAELNKLLDHFLICEKKYGMRTLSMGEVADLVIDRDR